MWCARKRSVEVNVAEVAAMRCSFGTLLLAIGLLVFPTLAGAETMTATLTLSSQSFIGVSEGGLTNVGTGFVPNGTVVTLTSTDGGASGTLDGLPLPSFTTGPITYSFNSPAPNSITFTFDAGTGELDFTNSILTSISRGSSPMTTTTVALTSPLTMTTETTSAGTPCGAFTTPTDFSGSRQSGAPGNITLVGGSCVPADASIGGPWLTQVKLVGTLTQFAPEPGTAALSGVALASIAALAHRRGHGSSRRRPRRLTLRNTQRARDRASSSQASC